MFATFWLQQNVLLTAPHESAVGSPMWFCVILHIIFFLAIGYILVRTTALATCSLVDYIMLATQRLVAVSI